MVLSFSACAVEPYPWFPNHGKPPEPHFPEILLSPGRAREALAAGRLRLTDLADPQAAREIGEGPPPLLPGGDPAAAGSLFLALELSGHENPRILAGGPREWAALRTEFPPSSAESPKGIGPEGEGDSILAGREAVLAAYGRGGFEIIDLRGPEVWGRSADPEGGRAGHIPHSLPFDFSTLLEDGAWPDPASAREHFLQLGPRKREHVDPAAVFILYGVDESDRRLGLAYLLMRMMDLKVRVYREGWRGWEAEAGDPVVRIIGTRELEGLLRAENPELVDDFDYASLAFLDLRGAFDFRRRHLPGAISLPIHLFADSLSSLVAKRWPDADRASLPMVLYCYGPGCVRSRNAATMAARRGFRELLWFRAGLPAWKGEDLPTYKGARP